MCDKEIEVIDLTLCGSSDEEEDPVKNSKASCSSPVLISSDLDLEDFEPAFEYVRHRAGLNNPLALFTTNCSESLNNVIKMEVDWKESKLPLLVEYLQSIGDRQNAELERAVISRGEWSFLSEYRHLMRSEAEWFSHMTPEAKKRHVSKIYNTKPNSALQCNESGATSPSSALTPAVANT